MIARILIAIGFVLAGLAFQVVYPNHGLAGLFSTGFILGGIGGLVLSLRE